MFVMTDCKTWLGLADVYGQRLQRGQERERERAQGVFLGDRGGKPVDSVSRGTI